MSIHSPAERAWFRLAAGSAILKICEQKGVGDKYTLEQFYTFSQLFIDPVPQVRERILMKLHKVSDISRLRVKPTTSANMTKDQLRRSVFLSDKKQKYERGGKRVSEWLQERYRCQREDRQICKLRFECYLG